MDDQLSTTLTQLWDSLTDEQKAKARACTTMEELLAFAGEEKIELPDELMDAAGGLIYHNEDTNDYEVINDTDGHVMAYIKTNADYNGNLKVAEAYAKAKALELGQSDEGTMWYHIKSLRGQISC